MVILFANIKKRLPKLELLDSLIFAKKVIFYSGEVSIRNLKSAFEAAQ